MPDETSPVARMTALQNSKGTIASTRKMEKIIYDFYTDLFDSHVHLPPYHLRENGHVIPEVLPPEVRHALMLVRNCTHPVTRSRQNKTRTPEEPSANTHQHPSKALYTVPVGMQGS
ncbi:hypothetical protein RB195_009883 [Necator americanus]|uniref:PAZ domain-containing protein n=1 Tax=Necator americanus TaxID=51031 RepID=A0ABR1CWK5_NECAM